MKLLPTSSFHRFGESFTVIVNRLQVFFLQAFTLYEEEISDSKAQFAALTLMAATLEKLDCFGEENAAPVRSKCALLASALLRKPDQCRALILVSNLFWSSTTRELEGKPVRSTIFSLDQQATRFIVSDARRKEGSRVPA